LGFSTTIGNFQKHLADLEGTTLQKVIDGVDDELFALVLQKIISSTLKHSHILALVGDDLSLKQ
jgi:hypothetical protein